MFRSGHTFYNRLTLLVDRLEGRSNNPKILGSSPVVGITSNTLPVVLAVAWLPWRSRSQLRQVGHLKAQVLLGAPGKMVAVLTSRSESRLSFFLLVPFCLCIRSSTFRPWWCGVVYFCPLNLGFDVSPVHVFLLAIISSPQ